MRGLNNDFNLSEVSSDNQSFHTLCSSQYIDVFHDTYVLELTRIDSDRLILSQIDTDRLKLSQIKWIDPAETN